MPVVILSGALLVVILSGALLLVVILSGALPVVILSGALLLVVILSGARSAESKDPVWRQWKMRGRERTAKRDSSTTAFSLRSE